MLLDREKAAIFIYIIHDGIQHLLHDVAQVRASSHQTAPCVRQGVSRHRIYSAESQEDASREKGKEPENSFERCSSKVGEEGHVQAICAENTSGL